MNKKIIFISIDGMTDQLGQSQVLPYLIGLSGMGFDISIVSCEKQANFQKNEKVISEIVHKANIKWNYCFYEGKIPIYSQYKNVRNLYKLAKSLVFKENRNIILHARSYLPALVASSLKKKYNTKFIFDMRGFWADERIDGGIWRLSNPIQKQLYNYFKRKEREFIQQADYIVTLTENAKNEIGSWKIADTKMEVIPCCADVNYFLIKNNEERKTLRQKTGIAENAYVLGYLGSLGTWYMLDEMLDFFVELQKAKLESIFFFVTNDNERDILFAAEKKGINLKSIIVKVAKRHEVADFISCFNSSVFFIKPLYSKKGSSPTKMAEILACGIPVITNTNIGDVDGIVRKTNCGVLVDDFNSTSYKKAIAEMNQLSCTPQQLRDTAIQEFSLEIGLTSYKKIYDYLSK